MKRNILQTLIEVFWREVQGLQPVKLTILFVIEAVCIFILGALIQKKRRITYRKLLHVFLCAAYLSFILDITIFRRAEGSRKGSVRLNPRFGLGLLGGNPSAWASSFSMFNILLFIPVGLLSYPWLKKVEWKKRLALTTLIGICISISIECMQFVTGRGIFEIADIMTNTIGSLIGALLACIIIRNRKLRI